MAIAAFTNDGLPLGGKVKESPDLEYFFDSPTNWVQSIYPPMTVRVAGWAISHKDSPILITLSENSLPLRTILPKVYRPDVRAVFAKLGKIVPDRCGFEFDLAFDTPLDSEKHFIITITNEYYSSGPIEFMARPLHSIQWSTDSGVSDKLLGPQRADYKTTWTALSQSEREAKFYVIGTDQEKDFQITGEKSKNTLLNTVGINKDDVVLELGCGVGRVAALVAPICKKLICTDVSENMLDFARQRTQGQTNLEFHAVNGWDLAPIADQSVDLVYCTIVFMHLEEWERYNYICEAKRILKPGGRLYVDNFNLGSEEGWKVFIQILRASHPLKRPAHIGKFSTPEELRIYFERAGFENIKQSELEEWVLTWGVKP